MAAEGEQRAASEVSQALARNLNCLNDDNKSTRRRALAAIQKEVEDKRLSSGALQEVFGELLRPLLRSLADPMEKCREVSIQILTYCVTNVPRPEESLPYLIPTITQRLGHQEITEPSEELRLGLSQLLTLLVEVCGRKLGPYLEEMVRILQRTIVDPFPEVKKESCRCAANYARIIPGNVTPYHTFTFQEHAAMCQKCDKMHIALAVLFIPMTRTLEVRIFTGLTIRFRNASRLLTSSHFRLGRLGGPSSL